MFSVKTVFKSPDHTPNLQAINKFTTILGVKVILSCFKQLPLKSTLIFELCHFSFGERLLFEVVGGFIFSFENTLDSRAAIASVKLDGNMKVVGGFIFSFGNPLDSHAAIVSVRLDGNMKVL